MSGDLHECPQCHKRFRSQTFHKHLKRCGQVRKQIKFDQLSHSLHGTPSEKWIGRLRSSTSFDVTHVVQTSKAGRSLRAEKVQSASSKRSYDVPCSAPNSSRAFPSSQRTGLLVCRDASRSCLTASSPNRRDMTLRRSVSRPRPSSAHQVVSQPKEVSTAIRTPYSFPQRVDGEFDVESFLLQGETKSDPNMGQLTPEVRMKSSNLGLHPLFSEKVSFMPRQRRSSIKGDLKVNIPPLSDSPRTSKVKVDIKSRYDVAVSNMPIFSQLAQSSSLWR